MTLATESYLEQARNWPTAGRHILAHYDEGTNIVYQAYSRSIGRFAASNGFFGGDFSYDRMSWVKPNFLWMMYRSDWGRSPDQEVVLAVRLRRSFFDALFVATQRGNAVGGARNLVVPVERVYAPPEAMTKSRIELDSP